MSKFLGDLEQVKYLARKAQDEHAAYVEEMINVEECENEMAIMIRWDTEKRRKSCFV